MHLRAPRREGRIFVGRPLLSPPAESRTLLLCAFGVSSCPSSQEGQKNRHRDEASENRKEAHAELKNQSVVFPAKNSYAE